jgi:hypothetical protein|tara:strand:- start:380 stop:514 length:135 start_codon:yes stop_codon:yes gene_type:complete
MNRASFGSLLKGGRNMSYGKKKPAKVVKKKKIVKKKKSKSKGGY